MRYYIAKTGLEIFDLCRAYGLAVLLDHASPEGEDPVINEAGYFYLIEHGTKEISQKTLLSNTAWHSLFEESRDDRTWSRIFLTYKQKWFLQTKKVKEVLSKDFNKIVEDFKDPAGLPSITHNKGETLPGPLDPSAFKGLRGKTASDYSEKQLRVDAPNWALACLGGTIAGRYKIQKSQGNRWDYFVLFPVPQKIEINNFRKIRASVYTTGLRYLSVQSAAAHFSILLAKQMHELAVSKSRFSDRFSDLFYFSMIQSGQQYKPSTGGNMSLYPLMDLALSGRPVVAKVFEVWNFLFRKGSVQGCDDLAEAITRFTMCPSVETYEKHAKVFLKYISQPGEIKHANLYDHETLKEVIDYVG